VKATVGRLSDAIERLLPFLLFAAIVAIGFLWLIQPRLGAYLRTRTDVATLAGRVTTLQHSADRARGLPPADMQTSMRDFERQMSREDKVADVAAALAKAVLDRAPPDTLRGFAIETGNRIQQASGAGGWSSPRVASATTDDESDPRASLFGATVSYTPLRITFESTFEAIATFLWKVRDLPTTVEVRSVTLTRGLPLMKVDVRVRVFQRGDVIDPGQALRPGEPAPMPAGATAPRVSPFPGAEG
jgi:hypothetical protein